jgi:DNA processing protein
MKKSPQNFFITQKQKVYPEILGQIYDPPKKLWYKGRLEVLNKPCIAVVGTRRPSEYGEFMAEKIVSELADFDVVIVSGLARGIDTIAHETALKNEMPTIAILGSGIEHIYPKENKKLAEQIIENGLILSEFEEFDPPINFHFVQRNRIISGLSLGTIVVEAPDKSGALITADYAIEHNREVFVVPGDTDRKQGMGTLKLLKYGSAHPISEGKEVMEILRMQNELPLKNPQPQGDILMPTRAKIKIQYAALAIKTILSSNQQKILSHLSKTRGITPDTLCEKTNIPIGVLLSEVSILEMKDFIKIRNGKYFLLE